MGTSGRLSARLWPVVASGQGQFLDQAQAGLMRVAAPGDPEELRRVIIDLLDDREAATTVGKTARAHLEVVEPPESHGP